MSSNYGVSKGRFTGWRGGRWGSLLLSVLYLLLARSLAAQSAPQGGRPGDALHQLNDAVEALVQRVSPSVVQIMVMGYG